MTEDLPSTCFHEALSYWKTQKTRFGEKQAR
jgi:hypothetical protein